MTQQSNVSFPGSQSKRRARSAALRSAGVSLGLIVSGAVLSACSAKLVPLSPNDDGVASASSSGVQVQAVIAGTRQYIPRSLTPVKLSVRNLSPEGVYVSLEDIRLVGKDIALPAVEPIDIEPRRPVPTLGLDPASPFSPQSAVNSMSAVPVLNHGFGFDPLYPSSDFQGWHSYRDYARHEIEKDAFNGGFIESGEAQQGYVYFQAPPAGVDRVELEVRLHSGAGSGPGVVVEIPYATKG